MKEQNNSTIQLSPGGCFFFFILFFQFCNQADHGPQKINDKIAVANGSGNFKKVKMIEFVFNVQRDTTKASSRHWQWFPGTNDVVFITDTSSTKFKRYDTIAPELKKLNARFTNDEYWLLFPYHLTWDSGYILSDKNIQLAPISGKNLQLLSIQYNATDGFTPGDRYDIYINEKLMIEEWAFHRAGAAEPSLITTWANYTDHNGLQIAADHRSKDGKFRIWFTGIQVKK